MAVAIAVSANALRSGVGASCGAIEDSHWSLSTFNASMACVWLASARVFWRKKNAAPAAKSDP